MNDFRSGISRLALATVAPVFETVANAKRLKVVNDLRLVMPSLISANN